MLYATLEGWDGVESEREVQEGGNICILMADSHCCMAEANPLHSIYPPIKKKERRSWMNTVRSTEKVHASHGYHASMALA